MWNCQIRRRLAILPVAAFVLVFLAAPAARAVERPAPPKGAPEVEVTLVAKAAVSGPEIVNFAVPLPPGFLSDASLVRVVDEKGVELEASVRSLEPWRIDGRDGTIRSVQIQFPMEFGASKSRKVKVLFGKAPSKAGTKFVPVAKTLIAEDGLAGPRILAVLPAKWLCDSWVVGPQVPASDSAGYEAYNGYIEVNYPGTRKFADTQTYDHWLFDRTAGVYKMYVRTGDSKFLEGAYHDANFVRQNTRTSGPGAGVFTLKDEYDDLKYVYPRAMHIHYLLTGDERAREIGVMMARYSLNNWDPVYKPNLGKGGERVFWTERHTGYGFLGVLHGWELTGELAYWDKARLYAYALWRHQQNPPDGRPADGSFRRASVTDKGFRGSSSAWMTSILIDPIFNYWMLTGDSMIPEMVLDWCDFLDRNGIRPDGRQAYYMITSPQSDPGSPPSDPGPDMELHNTEIAYMFSMGVFFSEEPDRTARFRKRFETFFPIAMAVKHFEALDHRKLPGRETEASVRSFNWAVQASPQLIYFMKHPGGRPTT